MPQKRHRESPDAIRSTLYASFGTVSAICGLTAGVKRTKMPDRSAMRHIKLIAVGVLTFVLGVLVSVIGNYSLHTQIPPISQSTEDSWHRLFEAAQMANDDELRDQVLAKLHCMNPDGALTGHLVFDDSGASCWEGLAIWTPDSDKYSKRIKAHGEWSRHNMPFIKSIAHPPAARQYVRERLDAREGPIILE
jgi:hypothetical protein